jgi:hypothetical protein
MERLLSEMNTWEHFQVFKRLAVLGIVLSCALGWSPSARADGCVNVELRRQIAAGEDVLKSATDVAALPKLKEAYDKLSALNTQAGAQSDFCRQAMRDIKSQAASVLARLRAQIAKLGDDASKVNLAFSVAFEGAAQDQDLRAIRLDGELMHPTGKYSTSGADHTLVVEFEPPRTRDLTFDVRIDNTPAPDIPAERTEGSRSYIMPRLEPGQHSVSIIIKGKERAQQRYLEVVFFEGTSPDGISLMVEDVEYQEFDKKIALPSDKSKLDIKVFHPTRETDDGWFRIGAKLGTKNLKPIDSEHSNTTYTIPIDSVNTRLRLKPVTGPKKSPAREPVMWIGAGITALGGAFALINFMSHLDLEEKWLKEYDKKECGQKNPPSVLCTPDVEKDIDEMYQEDLSAQTYAYIGLGVAGAGLVTLAIGYFVLEEGETPPRDLARTTGTPNTYARGKQPTQAASLNFVPVLSPNTVGGVLSGRF